MTSSSEMAARLRSTARPDPPHRPWILVNMVASVDGAATLAGRSGELGGPVDRTMFTALRSIADAIVVGARTAMIEGYRPPRTDDAVLREQRLRAGQRPQPDLLVITRSGNVGDFPALTAGTGGDSEARVSVLRWRNAPLGWAIENPADTDPADTDPAGQERTADETAITGANGSILPRMADACRLLRSERRYRTVLCEGGPNLLGSLHSEDLIDEWCVTIGPMVVGGDASRINVSGPHVTEPRRLQLVDTIIDDSTILTRYVRDRST